METDGRKKREVPEEQRAFIERVKRELDEHFTESKLNKSQLLSMLEETYGFPINKGTLDNLFKYDNPNIDFICFVTVCHFFGININGMMTLPILTAKHLRYTGEGKELEKKSVLPQASSARERDPFFESVQAVRQKFPVLKDEGYVGEFKGFIMPPTTSNDSISDFDLTMKKDEDGVMRATVVRTTSYYSSKARKMKTEKFIYHGVPVFAKKYKAVLLFLTEETANGEFYLLSFGFEEYRTDEGLVFRQGLSLTGEAFGRGSLVAQNFLIFNKPIEESKMKYISGLLKAPNNEVCISVEEANKLAARYPEVRRFMDELSGVLKLNKKEMYVLDEDNILTDKTSSLSRYDRIKALLLLKSKSTVGGKYYYQADCKYAGFVKNYLLNDEKEVSSENMYKHPQ